MAGEQFEVLRKGLLPYVEKEGEFYYVQGSSEPAEVNLRTALNAFQMENEELFQDLKSFATSKEEVRKGLRFGGVLYGFLREGGRLASPDRNDVDDAILVMSQGLDGEINRLWKDNPGIASIIDSAPYEYQKELGVFLYNSIEIRSEKLVKNPPLPVLVDNEPSLRKEILERQWDLVHYLEEYELARALKEEYGSELPEPKD